MNTTDLTAHYREHGFVVVPNVVEPATLRNLSATTDRLVADARGLTGHTDVYDLEETHQPDAPRVRRIKRPHAIDKVYDEMARYPRFIEILVGLLGPDIRLQSSILNMKSAGYGAALDWHQDCTFYPHTNDDLLVAGVFLDDVGEDNGPVQFLPGTQRGPIYDHHRDGRFVGAIRAADIVDLVSTAKTAIGAAGSVSFHHCRVVHGSSLNRSNRPRRILYYEMNSADAWPLLGLTKHYGPDPDKAFDVYNSRIVAGRPCEHPRLEKIPVEIPLPPPLHQGSIYEAQKSISDPFFDRTIVAR